VHWVRGALLGIAVAALPATLAVNCAFTGDDVEERPSNAWWEVVVPALVLLVVETAVASLAAPAIAFQLVEERSSTTSIKETVLSSLKVQAAVSALLLIVTVQLLSAEPPTDDRFSRIAQWYTCQLAISLMCHSVGLFATFFYIAFVQPLRDSMVLAFLSANMMYFGESMAFSLVGLCNLLCAAGLWVLGQHGARVAAVGCCAIFFACTRIIVIYSYFSLWQSPDLSAETRRERLNWATTYSTTGKHHLGLNSREKRVRDARRFVNEALDVNSNDAAFINSATVPLDSSERIGRGALG